MGKQIVILLLLCSFLIISRDDSESSGIGAHLTFEQRVAYQRALEEVYWRHRIWPEENKTPKPSLDQVLPTATIRSKVEDYLKESNALDEYWQRPIKPQQLQAEILRMVSNTRQPHVLKELFEALGNDPQVIAECLARPILADRLIHNMYAGDSRFHGALRAKAESERANTTGVETMPSMSGAYHESVWKKAATNDATDIRDGSISLDEQGWKEWIARLQQEFGNTSGVQKVEGWKSTSDKPDPSREIPVRKLTDLQEDASRFFVMAVLEMDDSHVKVATVEWKKQPFEEWWDGAKQHISSEILQPHQMYILPPVSSNSSCTDDTWSPIHYDLPTGRSGHSAIWTGTEMIIWGGLSGPLSHTNTGGRYNPSTDTWAAGTSLINAPTGRYQHSAVWTGLRMIIWGGYDGSNYLNTGGLYDPSTDTWSAVNMTNAPSTRVNHTSVWTGSEMIVWGGYNGTDTQTGGRYDPVSDTWFAAGTSTTGAPSARDGHSAIWTGSEMIVWGGYAMGYTNTGGRYNPSTDSWASGGTSTTAAPSGRGFHATVWTGSEMIVWGGYFFTNTGGRYNPATDSWAAGGTSTVNAPSARYLHTGIWTGSELIIWGGYVGGEGDTNTGGRYNPITDTWPSSGTSTTDAPAARESHTAIWTGTEMIVWGGKAGNSYTNSGSRYDPSNDTWVAGGTSLNGAPSGRVGHTAVWTGTEMIVWGGSDDNYTNTGGSYSAATDSWLADGTSLSGAPSARGGHTAVWTGTEMIVWGGYGDAGYENTGGRYDPSNDIWAAVNNTNAPSARSGHTAIWTGTDLIIWGGIYTSNYLDSGGRYNPSIDTWASGGTSMTNAPSGRYIHTAVWTGTEMIVWGGFGNGTYFNTGGRYDPLTDTWIAGGTDTTNAPSPRSSAAVWTGAVMIIWGGFGGNAIDTGGRYDPSTNTWVSGGTSTTGAPSARYGHTAVWNGSEMIAWGGNTGGDFIGTGGRYSPSTDSWANGGTSTLDAPSSRSGHTALWIAPEMIVWGGVGSPGLPESTGGRYCATNPCPALSVDQATTPGSTILHNGTVGVPYSETFTASGGAQPYVFSTTDILPAGLFLDASGLLNGTPIVPVSNSFTVIATDTNGCPGSQLFTLTITCLFCDDFEDGILSPNWTYFRPGWAEVDGNLVGTPTERKAKAIATPIFAGCSLCTVESSVSTAGGIGNKIWLFGWYVDKRNTVEVLMKEEDDKWILRQRVNGVVVSKSKGFAQINPNTFYDAQLSFNGSTFTLIVDGTTLAAIPAVGNPGGTVGYQVKNTVGSFGFVIVN